MQARQNLRQADDDGQERGLGQEIGIVKQAADPRAKLLERGDGGWLGSALHHLGHAHGCTGLDPFVLLPHGLKQGPDEEAHHAVVAVNTSVLEVEGREGANGVTAGVPDGGVVVLEALYDVGDDLGEVGGGSVGVGGACEGEEA